MIDLLELCAELVRVPSVSHEEAALADLVEAELRSLPWIEVTRVGDNVVGRTSLGRTLRVIFAGHLDTVPPSGNYDADVVGDTLYGLGAADMKSGLAVQLALARALSDPEMDVTYVFYAGEEVDRRHNGLAQLAVERADLLAGDVAVLGEPTANRVEAGCQGTLRVAVTLVGRRAHTARPWTGTNAVHRAGPLIAAAVAFEGRRPVLTGCEFRESLQVVRVEGGVANNVVPDRARLVLNYRFAPDRSAKEAVTEVERLVRAAVELGPGDVVEVEDCSDPAPPCLDHPVLSALVDRTGEKPTAKLGWTDVSFFAARGVPATNFGPGDPELAHSPDERVRRADLERAFAVLAGLVGGT
jgi:succinyl-diaminopimelate desuccinylase